MPNTKSNDAHERTSSIAHPEIEIDKQIIKPPEMDDLEPFSTLFATDTATNRKINEQKFKLKKEEISAQ
jgi:hypothetical protein